MHRYFYINNKWNCFYFCDICGKIIDYDPKQLKNEYHKEMYVPFISNFSINKNGETVFSNYVGNFHFHSNCFDDKVKSIFIKRKVSKSGRESFKLNNYNE